MLKILSAKQIKEADQYTIDHEPISSIDLMERAATELLNWIEKRWQDKDHSPSFTIFSGVGNNGGDGVALARLLTDSGYSVKVFVVEISDNYSEEFSINLNRLRNPPSFLKEEDYDFSIDPSSVIIDAIFGIGLNRKVEGFTASIIQQLNSLENLTLSIDLPSALFAADNSDNDFSLVVRADYTLSIQFIKLSTLFPASQNLVGILEVLPIGISQKFIDQTETSNYLLQMKDAAAVLKERSPSAHKGDFGKTLLLAGSKGKMGAGILAARACLRSGVGLLFIQTPARGESILQSAVPEAMHISDDRKDYLSKVEGLNAYDAIGIGPGIDQKECTQKLLLSLLKKVDDPILLDADALNILANNKNWLSYVPPMSILTPHPGEFKRLVGDWKSDYERNEKLKAFAAKYEVIVVLKGRFTTIALADGDCYFNTTGNSGMATGGSGDVLSGMLTSFLSQGYSPKAAAILGVYIHGLAGDIALEKLGPESMLPSDLIDCLPKAFKKIREYSNN